MKSFLVGVTKRLAIGLVVSLALLFICWVIGQLRFYEYWVSTIGFILLLVGLLPYLSTHGGVRAALQESKEPAESKQTKQNMRKYDKQLRGIGVSLSIIALPILVIPVVVYILMS